MDLWCLFHIEILMGRTLPHPWMANKAMARAIQVLMLMLVETCKGGWSGVIAKRIRRREHTNL